MKQDLDCMSPEVGDIIKLSLLGSIFGGGILLDSYGRTS